MGLTSWKEAPLGKIMKSDVSIAKKYLTDMADDREILTNAGSITAEIAKAHAEREFERYRIIQDRLYESDYDRFLAMEKRQAASDDGEIHLLSKNSGGH